MRHGANATIVGRKCVNHVDTEYPASVYLLE